MNADDLTNALVARYGAVRALQALDELDEHRVEVDTSGLPEARGTLDVARRCGWHVYDVDFEGEAITLSLEP